MLDTPNEGVSERPPSLIKYLACTMNSIVQRATGRPGPTISPGHVPSLGIMDTACQYGNGNGRQRKYEVK